MTTQNPANCPLRLIEGELWRGIFGGGLSDAAGRLHHPASPCGLPTTKRWDSPGYQTCCPEKGILRTPPRWPLHRICRIGADFTADFRAQIIENLSVSTRRAVPPTPASTATNI